MNKNIGLLKVGRIDYIAVLPVKKLRTKTNMNRADSPEGGRGVVLSPGALFFTHVMDWPAGVQAKDLPALAALALEDVSPFALDALAWGFCSDAASQTLFLYAACLPRMSAAGQEQWALATHVYPAFLPLIASRAQKTGAESLALAPQWELLQVGGEVLLLERTAGSRWPHRIYTEALENEESAQAVFSAAARLLVKAGFAATVAAGIEALGDIGFWQFAGAKEGRRHEIRFTLQGVDGSAAKRIMAEATLPKSGANVVTEPRQGASDSEEGATGQPIAAGLPVADSWVDTLLVGEEALWQADVRTESFITLARKSRIASQRLWCGLCVAAGVAVLLVVALLVFWGLGSMLKTRTQRIAAQASQVERIRQDQDLLMRMRQFSAEPFEPFSLIGVLKATKPDPIYFDSIELIGADSVVVEGQGPTVDAVNAYVRALEQGGGFRSARQARMSLKDGASVFTLYLQYLGKPAPAQPTVADRQSTARSRQGGAAAVAGRQAAGGSSSTLIDPQALAEAEEILDFVELQATQGEGGMRLLVAPELAEDDELQNPFPSELPARAVETSGGAVVVGGRQAANPSAAIEEVLAEDADSDTSVTVISVNADGTEETQTLFVDPLVLEPASATFVED